MPAVTLPAEVPIVAFQGSRLFIGTDLTGNPCDCEQATGAPQRGNCLGFHHTIRC